MLNTSHPLGRLFSIQLCPGHRKPMQMVDRAEVIENLGLKNDRHALPDSSRQILLIEKETLDGLGLKPGQVKENITTVGIELMALPSKQCLKIGDEVILEVTKGCSPCSRMDEIRPGLKPEIAGKRGMLTRVIRGGIIAKGDTIIPVRE
ncbi:MAG: MOSC domain-containing protein [Ignavibacteriales bacterium]|nr:MOSC domain-containing protein [Ignavibacteriales bacterium]